MYAQGYWKMDVISELATVTFPLMDRDLLVQVPHIFLALSSNILKFMSKLLVEFLDVKNQIPNIFAEFRTGIPPTNSSFSERALGYSRWDLAVLTFSPDHFAKVRKVSNRQSREARLLMKQVRSSANCEILTSVWWMRSPLMSLLFRIKMANISTTKLNRNGDAGQPCLMPLHGLKNLEV